MSSTALDATVDTSAMPTIHSFLHREFRLAGGLVRGLADNDHARAKVVGHHIDFLMRHLHHHHTIEDELLWPVVLRKVPEELAPLVHLMESQHARVDALVEAVVQGLPGLVAGADATARERLADVLDELYVHLVEHLDAEEERLLPLVARTVTQDEWDALGEAGRRGGPRKEMTLSFGMFQHDGDPEAVAKMLADAPAPVRWLVPRLARRAFRRHALRVHGTATP